MTNHEQLDNSPGQFDRGELGDLLVAVVRTIEVLRPDEPGLCERLERLREKIHKLLQDG